MSGTSEKDLKQDLALGELELAFELDQLQRTKTVHIGDTKSREARIAALEKDVARCTTLLANFKVSMVWYGMAWYSMVWYGIVWHSGACAIMDKMG